MFFSFRNGYPLIAFFFIRQFFRLINLFNFILQVVYNFTADPPSPENPFKPLYTEGHYDLKQIQNCSYPTGNATCANFEVFVDDELIKPPGTMMCIYFFGKKISIYNDHGT